MKSPQKLTVKLLRMFEISASGGLSVALVPLCLILVLGYLLLT